MVGDVVTPDVGEVELGTPLERIERGRGTDTDVEEIGSWLDKVTDGARCYLATEERQVIASILESFPEEVVEHLERGGCARHRGLGIPKLVDLAGGQSRYDEGQAFKQPDWTYAHPAPRSS